jgi:hypothetical protein
MTNHGLRTTGTHTGNFGRAKCKGKPGELDLTDDILNRENLKIPDRDEAFTQLVIAYNTTTDPKLKAGLWEILKRRRATLQQTKVKPNELPESPYWENIRRVR